MNLIIMESIVTNARKCDKNQTTRKNSEICFTETKQRIKTFQNVMNKENNSRILCNIYSSKWQSILENFLTDEEKKNRDLPMNGNVRID